MLLSSNSAIIGDVNCVLTVKF